MVISSGCVVIEAQQQCSTCISHCLGLHRPPTPTAFGVVGVESKKQLAFGFLEKVKGEFIKEYGARALDAGPGSLESSFGYAWGVVHVWGMVFSLM